MFFMMFIYIKIANNIAHYSVGYNEPNTNPTID